MSSDDAVQAMYEAYMADGSLSVRDGLSKALDAAAPHLTADLVRERDEAVAMVDEKSDMGHAAADAWQAAAEQAERERDEALAEVALLRADLDKAARQLDEALADARAAHYGRLAAEAEVARVEAVLPERDTGWSPVVELVDRIRAALRGSTVIDGAEPANAPTCTCGHHENRHSLMGPHPCVDCRCATYARAAHTREG
jgi:hypothetical protein